MRILQNRRFRSSRFSPSPPHVGAHSASAGLVLIAETRIRLELDISRDLAMGAITGRGTITPGSSGLSPRIRSGSKAETSTSTPTCATTRLDYTDPLGLTSEAACVDPDGAGSSVPYLPLTLAGRKDPSSATTANESSILLAAAPRRSQLSRCLDACAAGGRALIRFCNSLPDPRLRAGCFSLQFAGETACRGWCFWNFTKK